jgi:Flp pilus assembly protein TadD
VAAGAALTYRSHHRQKVLDQGMARARALVRADTYPGYRDAARLLEPLAELDPIEAGALRAFSLGMLQADYRDSKAGEAAEALLVEPGRAPVVPDAAQEAYAALALGRREVGTAASYAARATSPVALTLRARAAMAAGNLGGATEPLAQAVEADPTLPMALALRGDALRRTGHPAEARRAYSEALSASPLHPRATFGLAKLALSSQADAAEARQALTRLLDDREGTPRNERGRAALHLAALESRAGERAGAALTMDKAGLDPTARAWLEKAVADQEINRAGYRVAASTPAILLSASDDDPYVAPPPEPPRAEPAAPAKTPAKAIAKKKASKKSKAKATKAGKPKAKPGKQDSKKKKAKAKPKPPAKKKAPPKPADE